MENNNNNILDDHKFELKSIVPKPDKRLASGALVLFSVLIGGQLGMGADSETELVQGSYIWMPFLVLAIAAFFLPPKRAILLGILTVPVTYVFYETIWNAL